MLGFGPWYEINPIISANIETDIDNITDRYWWYKSLANTDNKILNHALLLSI